MIQIIIHFLITKKGKEKMFFNYSVVLLDNSIVCKKNDFLTFNVKEQFEYHLLTLEKFCYFFLTNRADFH